MKKYIKSAKLLATLMLGASMLDDGTIYYPTSQERERAIKCGMCQNFPKGKFCKLSKHHVCKETPAYKCSHLYAGVSKPKATYEGKEL